MLVRMKLSTAAALLALLAPFATAAPLIAQAPAQHEAPMPEKAPVPPSHSLTVTYQGAITTLTPEDLLKLPQVTVHVHNAHRDRDETYTGPLVSDVLARAGLSPAHENEALILHSTVVATGTDHYYVLYSCGEMEPAFSNGKVIVAVMKSGLPDTEGGNLQLINTEGAKPARWVHGLMSLQVMTLAPSK
jgi:hypothetical protein